jgi:hypothetical protein
MNNIIQDNSRYSANSYTRWRGGHHRKYINMAPSETNWTMATPTIQIIAALEFLL